MSTRFSLLALAAVATIGAAALAPTSASANLPMGVIVKPHPILGVVVHPPHPILGVVVHPPHPILGVVVHPPHPILGIVVHPPHPILGIVVHPPMDPDRMIRATGRRPGRSRASPAIPSCRRKRRPAPRPSSNR